jgi:Tfp pilus assembly protein PilN
VRPYFNLSAVGSFCLFLFLLAVLLLRIRGYEQHNIPALKKHAAPLQPVLERLEEYRRLRDAMASRHKSLQALEERFPLWEGVLRELSHIVPSDVMLTRVAPAKGAPAGAARVSMDGLVYSERRNKTLSEFMALIRKSPFFGEVLTWQVNPPLATEEGAPEGSSAPASFKLECTLLY